jgi:hypothetical protein
MVPRKLNQISFFSALEVGRVNPESSKVIR